MSNELNVNEEKNGETTATMPEKKKSKVGAVFYAIGMVLTV